MTEPGPQHAKELHLQPSFSILLMEQLLRGQASAEQLLLQECTALVPWSGCLWKGRALNHRACGMSVCTWERGTWTQGESNSLLWDLHF